MRKLSLVFAMTLAAGMAMAQNVSTTTQNGDKNSVSVEQLGSNTATVTQTAVDELVKGNDAEVLQVNGNGNEGTITQSGNKNSAWLNQGIKAGLWTGYIGNLASTNSEGIIGQSGSDNDASMEQYGNLNSATINQAVVTNAEAYVYQGWAYSGWGETAVTSALTVTNSSVSVIQENGDKDFAGAWQYGGDNDHITISQQDGDNNNAQVAQGFIYDDLNYNFSRPVSNVDDNYATVTQVGNNNVGKLMQLGDGNDFTLTQNGDGNQVGEALPRNGLLKTRNGYFKQDGNDNTFTGSQTNGAVLDATSAQNGNDNEIELTQGSGDLAKILQDGNWNEAYLTQGGGTQTATILQDGNTNVARVTQGL